MSGGAEVVVSPRIAGVQWSDTIESTLWGMVSGVAVVLDVVIGPAEIAPASCQPLQVAWSSIYGAVVFGGPCGPGSCMRQRQR